MVGRWFRYDFYPDNPGSILVVWCTCASWPRIAYILRVLVALQPGHIASPAAHTRRSSTLPVYPWLGREHTFGLIILHMHRTGTYGLISGSLAGGANFGNSGEQNAIDKGHSQPTQLHQADKQSNGLLYRLSLKALLELRWRYVLICYIWCTVALP